VPLVLVGPSLVLTDRPELGDADRRLRPTGDPERHPADVGSAEPADIELAGARVDQSWLLRVSETAASQFTSRLQVISTRVLGLAAAR